MFAGMNLMFYATYLRLSHSKGRMNSEEEKKHCFAQEPLLDYY